MAFYSSLNVLKDEYEKREEKILEMEEEIKGVTIEEMLKRRGELTLARLKQLDLRLKSLENLSKENISYF